MEFDWDPANLNHIARHHVSREETEQVLQNDPIELDTEAVGGEERFSLIGETHTGRILVVVATIRDDAVHPITAWDAPSWIKRQYHEERRRTWQF